MFVYDSKVFCSVLYFYCLACCLWGASLGGREGREGGSGYWQDSTHRSKGKQGLFFWGGWVVMDMVMVSLLKNLVVLHLK